MEKAALSVGSGGGANPSAVVSELFVYPIKSCRGISVPYAAVTSTGFRWDRQWVIVNAKGRMYTQRVEQKLALVQVELPHEAFSEAWVPKSDSYMVIKAPEMTILKVPLSAQCDVVDGVSVWEWSGSAYDEGNAASEWFTTYIGKPSRLVRFKASSEIRPVDPNYVPHLGYKVMFSDGYPFLLSSQASLDALNASLKQPISINRFRPNILVDGCSPFSEDVWKEIRINSLTFYGVKLCSRCKVPTVNQEKGTVSSEPNETLMKFRSDHVLRPNSSKKQAKIYFGQNLVCKDSLSISGKESVIRVGDPVHVLETVASAAVAPA